MQQANLLMIHSTVEIVCFLVEFLCKFFRQSDVLILDAIPINEYAITYRIIVPSFTVLKSISKSLNVLNIKPKVLSKKETSF
ncbi:MAG: hypothetical protein ACP5OK_04685 [Thermoprotei archaeon]